MKDTMELLTDALLDMRSDALKARAEREAQELTVWTVARIAPAPFELGGVRELPNGTGDTAKAFPDQCSRVSDLVRQAREWNGKARAGYSNVASYMHVGTIRRAGSGSGRATTLPRKVRQSKARRILGRA